MGSFQDAIQLAALTGGPADIAAVRHYQSRGGVSMNLEQQLVAQCRLLCPRRDRGWQQRTL